jgi:hypothetical protein
MGLPRPEILDGDRPTRLTTIDVKTGSNLVDNDVLHTTWKRSAHASVDRSNSAFRFLVKYR